MFRNWYVFYCTYWSTKNTKNISVVHPSDRLYWVMSAAQTSDEE